MTDNEIIKALEYVESQKTPHIISRELLDGVINCIKLQQAEIERLQNKCEDCAGCTSWKCDCANIKAEAIKEFAERLKNEVEHIPMWGSVATHKIDNLVKEMVGEE